MDRNKKIDALLQTLYKRSFESHAYHSILEIFKDLNITVDQYEWRNIRDFLLDKKFIKESGFGIGDQVALEPAGIKFCETNSFTYPGTSVSQSLILNLEVKSKNPLVQIAVEELYDQSDFVNDFQAKRLRDMIPEELEYFFTSEDKIEFLNTYKDKMEKKLQRHRAEGCPDPANCMFESTDQIAKAVVHQELNKIESNKMSNLPESAKSSQNTDMPNAKLSDKIFIVHGHNKAIMTSVENTVRTFKLTPIVLHKMPNGGKTIIEKFEQHADVGFAIIILSDDDEGKSKTDSTLQSRARQNVIFELGYFIGRFGRSKVMALYTKGVELPNDILGMVYTLLDDHDKWQYDLAKELNEAGYDVDPKLL